MSIVSKIGILTLAGALAASTNARAVIDVQPIATSAPHAISGTYEEVKWRFPVAKGKLTGTYQGDTAVVELYLDQLGKEPFTNCIRIYNVHPDTAYHRFEFKAKHEGNVLNGDVKHQQTGKQSDLEVVVGSAIKATLGGDRVFNGRLEQKACAQATDSVYMENKF